MRTCLIRKIRQGKAAKKVKRLTVYLGLGSNLNNKRANLLRALATLRRTAGIQVVKVSHFYPTKPVGVVNQPDFLNAVVKVWTILSPQALIKTLLGIEIQLGRVRPDVTPGGARIIDLDILFYERSIIRQRGLTIPHPRLHERWFVLKPLAEIAPRFIHPIFKKTIRTMLKELNNGNRPTKR